MEVSDLLALIPESLLSDLAIETGVNKYSKKLEGGLMFKLLLHCLLSYKDNSLRTMESAYESMAFKLLNAGQKSEHIRFSSISERLSVIEPEYFEKLYQTCIERYSSMLNEPKYPIIRFDSTIVALSGKLLKVGYQIKGGDADHLRQLKFTIGFSNLPASVHFFTEPIYTSENRALKEAVFAFKPSETGLIRIFDRGITARKTYDELTEKGIPFISRIGAKSKWQELTGNQLESPLQTETLTIERDRSIILFKASDVKSRYPIRCIEAKNKQDEPIIFITNISELSPIDVCLLYKYRWDIEVFFKFLKQELNFPPLLVFFHQQDPYATQTRIFALYRPGPKPGLLYFSQRHLQKVKPAPHVRDRSEYRSPTVVGDG